MDALSQHQPPSWAFNPPKHSIPDDNTFPVHLQMQDNENTRNAILKLLAHKPSHPVVSFETNKYRKSSSNGGRVEIFRETLLRELSILWNDPETTHLFLKLVGILETQGCAVFAGLIDEPQFTELISDFTSAMKQLGSQAFLHSFLNLAQHPGFLYSKNYRDAFVHPLLIALVSYTMGGAIRMTDVRGKDTQPISVNAQDNMLHIDNTPFREEFKILVGWERGVPRGPTGQNFTFLPGTHRGNRHIRVDASESGESGKGEAWSTENDSVFLTNEAVENVFAFQEQAYGQSPCVVEVRYPRHPITVAFSAGSLVHHRYRTEHGSARSCIIAAFHLAADNPGSLLSQAVDDDRNPKKIPTSILDLIFGHRGGDDSDEGFLRLLVREAAQIQQKIQQIFNDGCVSQLVDTSPLTLQGEALAQWKEAVINAPSTTSIKFGRKCFLTTDQTQMDKDALIHLLTDVMMYDKHGLLDLKLYADGREEIRKPTRKRIFCLKRETIADRLQQWLPAITGYKFTVADILEPAALKSRADLIARHLHKAAAAATIPTTTTDQISSQEAQLLSVAQLLTDLGESITRCDAVETYIATTLFVFWAIDQIPVSLDWAMHLDACSAAIAALRSYIVTTLLVEYTG